MTESQRTLHLNQFRGAAILIMASVLASRGIAFVRDSYIAYAYGAGPATDSYYVAFTIPDLLNYLAAGGALSITFIPILGGLLEKKQYEEGNRVFSTVATFMAGILLIGTVLGEWLAPTLLRWYQPHFNAEQLAQSVAMTRILLPGPLFFCLGGLLSATLYTRGSFLIPAITPLVYNLGTLLGGVFLDRWMGITSLAVGTMAGAILGPFLMPLVGSFQLGLRYRPMLDLSNPHFTRWLRTTVPLMLGVSIVTADDWFIRSFAGATVGAISHLNYAKRLTAVPIAVLGQAIGQAAMPFFSKLVNQGSWDQFRETVDRSVTRMVMGGILAVSLLEILALPAVRFVYQRGHFSDLDAQNTAHYFSIFLLSLVFWIMQGIYARAFYATKKTLAPMVQSTIVTILTLPVYYYFLHWFDLPGLAWASNTAILVQTIGLMWLLRSRDLVSWNRTRWAELLRTGVAALLAWAVGAYAYRWMAPATYLWRQELVSVAMVTLLWGITLILLARVLRLDELRNEAAGILAKLQRRFAGA